MDTTDNIVAAAFSEEHTSRLTGITPSQLRYWDREDFYRPSFADDNRRSAFSRIYSFRDIVALRVLNALRNQFGVSLQHLREVSKKLAHLENLWGGTKLWVVKKRVVWEEPGTGRLQSVIEGQYVIPVDLAEVAAHTKRDVEELSKREPATFGLIHRSRYINHNAPVISGTRIPVEAVKRFHEAGYTTEQIIREYPDLTEQDVRAAIEYDRAAA